MLLQRQICGTIPRIDPTQARQASKLIKKAAEKSSQEITRKSREAEPKGTL